VVADSPSSATAGTGVRVAGPWQVWRILLVANACSLIGNYVQSLALPLWVLAVTGSYTATGITFAAGTLPVVVCAPIAGRIVDRWSRRWVFVTCELLCALLVLALIFGVRAENFPVIYTVVALLRAAGSVSIPAVQALLKERVNPEEIRPVIAVFEVAFGAAMSLGPLIGVALSAGIGIEMALWVNLGSFVVAGLLGTGLRASPTEALRTAAPDGVKKNPGLEPLRWRHIDPRLRRVAVAEASYFLFLGSEVVIALAVFQESIGAAAAAVYQSLAGLGWIVGSYLFVRRSASPTLTVWAGAVVSAAAAAVLVLNGRTWNWAAVIVVGLLGGVGNVMIAGGATVVYQTLTGNEVIGRVFAYRRAVLNLLMTASYVTVPLIADTTGHPVVVLVVAGAANLLITTSLLTRTMLRGRHDGSV
jgi:MFS family permease